MSLPRRLGSFGLACGALTGLLVLGGCANDPVPQAAPTPTAAPADPNAGAPCTTRLRPGAGGSDGGLTLTPGARAEIDRLRTMTPEQRAAESGPPTDPAVASRLAEVRERVERATRPCAER